MYRKSTGFGHLHRRWAFKILFFPFNFSYLSAWIFAIFFSRYFFSNPKFNLKWTISWFLILTSMFIGCRKKGPKSGEFWKIKTSSGLYLNNIRFDFFLCYHVIKKSHLAPRKVLMLKNSLCEVLCLLRAQVRKRKKSFWGAQVRWKCKMHVRWAFGPLLSTAFFNVIIASFALSVRIRKR